MSKRVALAGFLHETNTFAPTRARFEDFVQGGGYMPMARGAAVLTQGRDINLGIGGAVRYGEEAGWDMIGRALVRRDPLGPRDARGL